MNTDRVYALMVRYVREIPHDFFRLFDITFYPIMDIMLWGFISLWIQTGGSPTSHVGTLMLLSVVLWMIVENTNREIVLNFNEELYAHNLVNIFVSPIDISEWLAAVITLAIVRATFVLILCSFIIAVVRGINILSLGLLLPAIVILLLMSGIAIGLSIGALAMRWGRRISTFVWSIPYLILSLSAVFYPISLLPRWAQLIGRAMPISYVFETLRGTFQTGRIDWHALLIGFVLNVVYLSLSAFLFLWAFGRSNQEGMAKLEYY